jgi:streptomycin 6-kinase
VADPEVPILDDEVRRRLGRRYGADVEPWLDALPAVMHDLAERWRLGLGPLVRRGTVSVVLHCRAAAGAPAILKLSPDRPRIAAEARALTVWRTSHVPNVLASDEDRGALLLEAIMPGTALDEVGRAPGTSAIATLVRALHQHRWPFSALPHVEERIAALYRSGERNYARRPDLGSLVPRSLYENGRRAADALAAEPGLRVVLHGDLTPANVLDGGAERGLVAIDPAACWGDPAFDTVDLLMWRADDLATLTARSQEVADRLGVPHERPLRWCAAFAAMVALEEAEAAGPEHLPSIRFAMLIDLARST